MSATRTTSLQMSSFHKRHEHEKLKRCYCSDCFYVDRKNYSSINSIKCAQDRVRDRNIPWKSTCNEIIQDNSESERKHNRIRLKSNSGLESLVCKSQNKFFLTQSMDDALKQQQYAVRQHQQEPAIPNQETKEIKTKTSAGCLLCNKLQKPQVTTKRSLSLLIISALIKLFPLIVPSYAARSLGNKRIKAKRQNLKSKAISLIRLILTLTRLLCVLQMTTVPVCYAIGNKVSAKQTQYGSQPQNIAILLSDNTTTMQTNQKDIEVKNLVMKSHHQLDIAIDSSPAPVLSTFLSPEQSPALTPVTIGSRIISFVNRDNILKQFQRRKISSVVSQDQPGELAASKSTPLSPNSSCSPCQLRKAKNDSLESIKMHILSKLKLKESPKIEVTRNVPQNILDDYYRRYDHNGRRLSIESSSRADRFNADSSQMESKKTYDPEEDYMQSDDPNTFYDSETLIGLDDDDIENYEDEVYSRVKSIYIFPTTPRMRHKKRNDFLSFRYENSEEMTIVRVILHFYIRGWEWIQEHDPELSTRLEMNKTADKYPEIIVSVHRAMKRASTSNYTHTIQVTESRQKIPSGLGSWKQIELNDLAEFWTEENESHQIIAIKTPETWMRSLIVTGVGKSAENKSEKQDQVFAAHIEVVTERKVGRHRRSTSLDCQESDNEVRCCRYPLKVNFTSFGWSFVVAPTDFDAYFCNGECKLGYLEQYTHTHIASLSRSASPCCSPTKMSSLTLLYFNLEQNLVLSTIPNMTVEKCSCS